MNFNDASFMEIKLWYVSYNALYLTEYDYFNQYLAFLKLTQGMEGWMVIAILMKTKSSAFDFDFDWSLWVHQNIDIAMLI